MSSELLQVTKSGFYCEAGDFYVDPWRPVSRAIITHAHSDHARVGSTHYLCAATCKNVLRARLGPEANIATLKFGERKEIGSAAVTLHPAGHILGSAQVEIESAGKIAVVSGDYKRQGDATCCSFSPVQCHVFVTESTFGLPVYQWPAPAGVFESTAKTKWS